MVMSKYIVRSRCGDDRGRSWSRRSAPWRFDDKAESPIEVYEWSVWVGNPAQPASMPRASTTTRCRRVVGTSRPKLEEKEAASRFPLSPISVVQFFGDWRPRHRRRSEGEEGHIPGALAGQQRARGAAPVVQVGLIQGPSSADSAELLARDPLVRKSSATPTRRFI